LEKRGSVAVRRRGAVPSADLGGSSKYSIGVKD